MLLAQEEALAALEILKNREKKAHVQEKEEVFYLC
jgi:hypothetical protein